MLEEQLKKFGLSEKEAKTYITLLALGESSVAEIVQKSQVKRSSAYAVLKTLQDKGLVLAVDGESGQKFRAAPPDKVAEIAEGQLKKQKEITEAVRYIVPDLKGVHKENKHRPRIKIFEGVDAIKEHFKDTLECREKFIRVASSPSSLTKILRDTGISNYAKERIRRGIAMRSIHPDTTLNRSLINLKENKTDETALLSDSRYDFEADYAIYDDKIAYLSTKGDGVSLFIEDKEMADIAKKIFDLAYVEAKRIESKDVHAHPSPAKT